uniref:Glycosyltransferase RgtA/B/C/D-like domain-containing protein n=1 Tax=Desulfatirhabdium butyrativorans TaxID=340467 RepID=A0A7C4RTM9_9BACT
MSTTASSTPETIRHPQTVFFDRLSFFAVLAVALVLRLWLAVHTTIVNPDGTLYIHQARLLTAHQWKELTSCGLSFVSMLPVWIAAAHHWIGDWIWAARWVTIFFGWAALIPLDGFLRAFFDRTTARITLLMAAVTPMMVSNSVEIVREPLMWFFAACGMWAMVHALRTGRMPWFALAGLSFLMGAWARVDAVLLICVGATYLAFRSTGNRAWNTLIFLLPVMAAVAVVLYLALQRGISIQTLFRGSDILGKLYLPLVKVHELRIELKALSASIAAQPLVFFLQESRQQVWLVAIGSLVNRTIEALFYPFALFFVIGIARNRQARSLGTGIGFAVAAALCGFILLYIHTLQTWMVYYRFVGLVLLPGSVFAAIGIRTSIEWLSSRTWLSNTYGPRKGMRIAVIGLCAAIVLAALPKNIKTPDADKRVYVEIAQSIASRVSIERPVKVMTSHGIQPWISFYANIDRPFPVCPLQLDSVYEHIPNTLDSFLEQAVHRGIRFWIWEERNWPAGAFDVDSATNSPRLERIGAYHHPDTGAMRLYEIR